MIDAREFLMRARLDAAALEAWIEAGWLMPHRNAVGWSFSEIDLARARLIRDLRQDLGINDDGVTVILDLLDQVHGLRRTLRSLLSALDAQSEAIRRRIADDLREGAGLNPPGELLPARQPSEGSSDDPSG